VNRATVDLHGRRSRPAPARGLHAGRPTPHGFFAALDGCVRLDNAAIDWLSGIADPGTPVEID
jgi:L,D-transpeptidase catalytic domain